MSARNQLRRLVDTLPEAEVHAALRFMQYLNQAGPADPVSRFLLLAPEEDEELPAGEARALDEALEQARRGEVTPWEDVKQRLG
jgi:hypothetical protein